MALVSLSLGACLDNLPYPVAHSALKSLPRATRISLKNIYFHRFHEYVILSPQYLSLLIFQITKITLARGVRFVVHAAAYKNKSFSIGTCERIIMICAHASSRRERISQSIELKSSCGKQSMVTSMHHMGRLIDIFKGSYLIVSI